MAKKKGIKGNDIEKRIKHIISETTGIPENKIKLNSNLRTDLGLDSFAAIELAYNIKEEFGILVETQELPNLHTVKDIIAGIENRT